MWKLDMSCYINEREGEEDVKGTHNMLKMLALNNKALFSCCQKSKSFWVRVLQHIYNYSNYCPIID
jgi:hypothetical protein